MDLDTFVRETLPFLHKEIDSTAMSAGTAMDSLVVSFDTSHNAWPYALPPREDDTYSSFSTAAMALFACSVLVNRGGAVRTDRPSLRSPMLRGIRLGEFAPPNAQRQLGDELGQVYDVARKNLIAKIEKLLKDSSNTKLTISKSFGDNDVLTMGWLIEVFDDSELAERSTWLKLVQERVRACLTSAAPCEVGAGQYSDHAFFKLRALLLQFRLKDLGKDAVDVLAIRKWFEDRLHLLLSHSSLSNGSFDAPELAFCIEALLVLDPEAHGLREVLSRSVHVLQEKQQHNPNLRPYRPLLSDERGFALLPLTIEVFNSLLRSLECMQGNPHLRAVVDAVKPILRRYVEWLLSQRITITHKGNAVSGWRSEHTRAQPSIHVWETSQVVIFLAHYATWRRSETEREAIEAAGIYLESIPKDREKYWPRHGKDLENSEPFAKEPIYEPLWNQFISPRNGSEGDASWSILLSGPPGTGKSTFAAYVAAELGWPLISLAPSDFLVGGGEKVEQRAKSLFAILNELRAKVILFDEIDRLVLDRDSAQYEQQGDIFQFMTPSMLPKLQKLRSLRRCVFVVATNYWERIDPAVKRQGRIDHQIVVMPPDLVARKRILSKLPEGDLRAGETTGYTFTELLRVRDDIEAGKKVDNVLKDGPSLRLEHYRFRFGVQLQDDNKWGVARGAFKPPMAELRRICELYREGGLKENNNLSQLLDSLFEAYTGTEYCEAISDLRP